MNFENDLRVTLLAVGGVLILSYWLYQQVQRWRQPAARNLAEWLSEATGDLVPSAQIRLRAEIAEHYAESVQHYQESDCSEHDAQSRALADLGSPRVAARRFSRQYFTQKETLVFDRAAGRHQGVSVPLLHLVVCLGFSILILKFPKSSALPDVFWSILVYLVWLVTIGGIVVRRWYARSEPPKASWGTFAYILWAKTIGALTLHRFYARNESPRVMFRRDLLVSLAQSLNLLVMLGVLMAQVSSRGMMGYSALLPSFLLCLNNVFRGYVLSRKLQSAPDEDLSFPRPSAA